MNLALELTLLSRRCMSHLFKELIAEPLAYLLYERFASNCWRRMLSLRNHGDLTFLSFSWIFDESEVQRIFLWKWCSLNSFVPLIAIVQVFLPVIKHHLYPSLPQRLPLERALWLSFSFNFCSLNLEDFGVGFWKHCNLLSELLAVLFALNGVFVGQRDNTWNSACST